MGNKFTNTVLIILSSCFVLFSILQFHEAYRKNELYFNIKNKHESSKIRELDFIPIERQIKMAEKAYDELFDTAFVEVKRLRIQNNISSGILAFLNSLMLIFWYIDRKILPKRMRNKSHTSEGIGGVPIDQATTASKTERS